MAEVIRYIDPDATGAGDGTSWADAYTSMSAWEAAEEADLVTAGDWHHAYCRASGGTADTTKVNVGGWTADATNYIHIEVDSGDMHGGARPSGIYRLDMTDSFDSCIDVQETYTKVEGLCASNKSSTSSFTFRCNVVEVEFINCLAYDSGTDGFFFGAAADGCYMVNCISFGSTGNGFHCEGSPVAMYNCVALNDGAYGFWADAFDTINAKNCYAGGATTADFGKHANGNFNITTCRTSDGSLSTTTVALSTSSGAYFTNVTAGSEDIDITSASSGLVDIGTDLSADATYAFDFDYTDTTRTGTWDVGPDEFVAAGGANAPTGHLYGPLAGSLGGPI